MNRLMDAQAIFELIPHRAPFLFVTQAEYVSETEIIGVALWPEEHPILMGHFPGKPIVPGVCQVEATAQLAGLLIAYEARRSGSWQPVDSAPMSGVLASIRQASFHAPLLPGQPLNLALTLRALSAYLYLVKAEGHLADRRVMACELVIALRLQI